MSRMRMVKPGFFTNDTLADLDPLARLLFIGLWVIADRSGRLEDRPKRIKAEVLPYDDKDVDKLLQDLHDSGFILRYQHGEHQFIQVINFAKHQSPHKKEAASIIPAPDLHHASMVLDTEMHATSRADTDTDTDTEYVGDVAPLSEVADATLGPDVQSSSSQENHPRADVRSSQAGQESSARASAAIFAEESAQYRLATLLRDAIRSHKPNARLPSTRAQLLKWAGVFDLMIRIDKRSPKDIAEMITWATQHEFWCSVILSPDKLRAKYDTMELQRQRKSTSHPIQNGHMPKQPVSARAAGFRPADEDELWKD